VTASKTAAISTGTGDRSTVAANPRVRSGGLTRRAHVDVATDRDSAVCVNDEWLEGVRSGEVAGQRDARELMEL
jgi:hypothetical protein